MVDPVTVAIVAAAALAFGLGSKSGASKATGSSVPADFGPFPAVLFFTSLDCENCDPAREILNRHTGLLIKEINFAEKSGLFDRVSLRGVPTALFVAENGTVIGKLEGVPVATDVAELVKQLQ